MVGHGGARYADEDDDWPIILATGHVLPVCEAGMQGGVILHYLLFC